MIHGVIGKAQAKSSWDFTCNHKTPLHNSGHPMQGHCFCNQVSQATEEWSKFQSKFTKTCYLSLLFLKEIQGLFFWRLCHPFNEQHTSWQPFTILITSWESTHPVSICSSVQQNYPVSISHSRMQLSLWQANLQTWFLQLHLLTTEWPIKTGYPKWYSYPKWYRLLLTAATHWETHSFFCY